MLAAGAVANERSVAVDKPLEPDSRHENIGELIAQFVQKSHYLHISVNDDLSSRVLDRYIDSLDSNRMYLLASDIADFDQY
ncbi:MAG: tail-specific protease, partial [Proteobacteria bacterium]|nr:tail-specific protease [Pseudomonadota bacterium]